MANNADHTRFKWGLVAAMITLILVLGMIHDLVT